MRYWTGATTTLAAAGALALALRPAPALAQLDNPDLMDTGGTITVTATADPNVKGFIQVQNFGNAMHMSGGATTFGTNVLRELKLYEPSKVARKANSAKLAQKSYVQFYVFGGTTGGPFMASTTRPDCKGGVTAIDTDLSGTPDYLKWKFSCADSAAAIDALGLSPAEQAVYDASFAGKPVASSGHN